MFAAVLMALATAGPAIAEKTDRDKPLNIESDRMNADDARKTAVFDGKVVLTQGTLVIRADRLTLRQDKDGYQFGTALGNLATFKQKRDGVNEYIEGEAERIEYDGRAETVQFFQRAHLKRDSGDDVRGNYISYNARTEFFSVQSGKEAQSAGSDGRVRAVIMPRKREGDAADSGSSPSPSAPRAQ